MAKRNVEDRLSALERQAAEIRVEAVEATEFRLVDKAGRVRGVMEMTESGPRLALLDTEGTVLAEVFAQRDGTAVRLGGRDGDTRVFVGAIGGNARIALSDSGGHQRAFIGVEPKGPTITLYDAKQKTIWHAPG